MPVAFFDLFDTDDHIDRVYKELKQVCFILIIMYNYVFSLFVLMQLKVALNISTFMLSSVSDLYKTLHSETI